MSTVTQETRGIDPAFVRAARWLRANGYDYDLKNTEKRLQVAYGENVYGQWWIEVHRLTEWKSREGRHVLDVFPATIQQGIDYLVVAGVLPDEMASWTPKPVEPEHCPRCKHGIDWHDEEGCTENCECPLPKKAADWLRKKLQIASPVMKQVALAEVDRVVW